MEETSMINIKKILCPIDFLPASQGALKYATALASSHNAKLKLLHVVEPLISSAHPYLMDVVSTSGSLKKNFEQQLEKVRAKVKAEGVDVESEVTLGNVALEIQRVIRNYKPDLVTMGTHGRRGLERWFMGSTTERLLRRSPVPLLTIADAARRPADGSRFKRILVTTDFSDGTADALDYAFAVAPENDAQITLLHVVQLPSAFLVEAGAFLAQKAEKEEELSKLVPAKIRRAHRVDTRVVKGTPYRVILNTLKREKIDLLVMNIHGKGMWERALLGSTAERVVRAARCPVMMIPPMAKAARKVPVRKQAA
jgi:nucleotide-binding universal stress UspA family protein